MPNKGRIVREVWLVLRSAGYTRGVRSAILSSATLRIAWTLLNQVANRLTTNMSKQKSEMEGMGGILKRSAAQWNNIKNLWANASKEGGPRGLGKVTHVIRNMGAETANLAKVWGTFVAIGIGAVVAGMAAGITKMALATFKLRERAQEVEEQFTRFHFTFGEFAPLLEQTIGGFGGLAHQMGLTRTQARSSLAEFGSMLQGMGIAQERAVELSAGFFKLAGDFGSFANMEPSEVLDKIKSGLAGMSRPLRALGVDITENALEMRGWTREMGNAARAEVILQTMTEQLIKQGGMDDLQKTINSVANAWRRLTAMFNEIKDVVSTAALPAIKLFINFAEPRLMSLGENAQETGQRIQTFLVANMSAFITILHNLQPVIDLAIASVRLLGGAVSLSKDEIAELNEVLSVNLDEVRNNDEAASVFTEALEGISEAANDVIDDLDAQIDALKDGSSEMKDQATDLQELSEGYGELSVLANEALEAYESGRWDTAEEKLIALGTAINNTSIDTSALGQQTLEGVGAMTDFATIMNAQISTQTRAAQAIRKAKDDLKDFEDGTKDASEISVTWGEALRNIPTILSMVGKVFVNFGKLAGETVRAGLARIVNLTVESFDFVGRKIEEFGTKLQSSDIGAVRGIGRGITRLGEMIGFSDEDVAATREEFEDSVEGMNKYLDALGDIDDELREVVLEQRVVRAEADALKASTFGLIAPTAGAAEALEEMGDEAEGAGEDLSDSADEADKAAEAYAKLLAQTKAAAEEDAFRELLESGTMTDLSNAAATYAGWIDRAREEQERIRAIQQPTMAQLQRLSDLTEAIKNDEKTRKEILERIQEINQESFEDAEDAAEAAEKAREHARRAVDEYLQEIQDNLDIITDALDELSSLADSIGLGAVGDVFGGLGDITSGVGKLGDLGGIGKAIGDAFKPFKDVLGAIPGIGQAISGAVGVVQGIVSLFGGRSFAERFGTAVDRFDRAVRFFDLKGEDALDRLLKELEIEDLESFSHIVEGLRESFDLTTEEGIAAYQAALDDIFNALGEGNDAVLDALEGILDPEVMQVLRDMQEILPNFSFLSAEDRLAFLDVLDDLQRIGFEAEEERLRNENGDGDGDGQDNANQTLTAIKTVTEFQASEMLGYLQDANRIALSNSEYNRISAMMLSQLAGQDVEIAQNVASNAPVPAPAAIQSNNNANGGSNVSAGGKQVVINLNGGMSPQEQAKSVYNAVLDILSNRSSTRRAGRQWR